MKYGDISSPTFLARKVARSDDASLIETLDAPIHRGASEGMVETVSQHVARAVSAVGDFAAGRVGSDFRIGLVEVHDVTPVTKLGQGRVDDGDRLSGQKVVQRGVY